LAIKIGVKDGREVMASWPTYQELKAIDEKKRTIEMVFSDETIDRDREVIKVAGWDIKNYKKNPVVLWAHNHAGLPIGRSEKTLIDGEQLKGNILFTTGETGNGLGEAVFNLFNNKFLNCGSVGFIGLEENWIEEQDRDKKKPVRREFLRQELLEYSICPVPANPSASVIRDISEFDSTEIRKEIGWMKDKGIMNEEAERFLLEVYDFLEERKTFYYPVRQCKHESCEEAKEKGGCEYGKEQAEEKSQGQESREQEGEQKEKEIDITNQEGLDQLLERVLGKQEKEEKQFEVQTLIFPKTKWDNVATCKTWAKEHDFRTDKVDESDSSWRFRQANPDDFTRLRTICINPGRTTPMDDCKVKAVGGPKKAIDIYDDEQNLIDFMLDVDDEKGEGIIRIGDSSWVFASHEGVLKETKDQHEMINHMMEAIGYMDKARSCMMDAMMAGAAYGEEFVQEFTEKVGAVLNAKNKARIKEAIKNLEEVLKAAGEEEEEEGLAEEIKELEGMIIDGNNEGDVEDWEEVLALLLEEEDVNL